MNPAPVLRNALRPTLLAVAMTTLGMAHGVDAGLRLRLSHSLTMAPQWHPPASPRALPAEPVVLTASTAIHASPRSTGAGTATAVHWASQAQHRLPGQGPCAQAAAPAWDRLELGEALALSLCKSPSLRQALASVAEQGAGVTLAETAKRPSWSTSLGANAGRNFITGATNTRSLDANLNLSWVLFDFGRSDADLTQARQTLSAALSAQSNALLESVRDLLQRYGQAVVADAALSASTDAEATARLTADAAQARYDAQVGTQIDRLQALTALAQATLAKVRAEGDWENARGQLALALGADITQPLRLANWEPWVSGQDSPPDLNALRAEAQANHPKLRAARAEMEALQAQLVSVKASGRGSVSLSANAGHSSYWGDNGTTTTVSNIPSTSLAITATLPIFNGRESDAQQARVMAQSSAKEAELEALQREVDTQLWQAHRAMITSAKSVEASERLLTAAQSTYEVAQGRYKAGVGSLVDLLTAQSALAEGKRQRVAALVDKLTSQTQLALAAGRVGF